MVTKRRSQKFILGYEKVLHNFFFGQDDKTIWFGYSMNFYDGCRIRLDRFENPETE